MKIKEEEIVKNIENGNQQAVFEQLYRDVFPVFKKFIRKNNGDIEDAHDLFQDALLIWYQQIKKNVFDEKYKVYGYLYRLSINRWINKIKRDKKITFSDDIDTQFEHIHVEEVKLSAIHPDKKQHEIIKEVFGKLGDKCSEILTLTTYYDLSIEDLQMRLEMKSEGAVKMQLKRCREKLVELLRAEPELINLIKS